jgi:hypothetical protein
MNFSRWRITTGIATGRFKTDGDFQGRSELVIAGNRNKISTSGTTRD